MYGTLRRGRTPTTDEDEDEDPIALSPTEVVVLRQLADGAKDEAISREVGCSLRTTRRTIATLMGTLGARSRFQAGVEAVRRGWV